MFDAVIEMETTYIVSVLKNRKKKYLITADCLLAQSGGVSQQPLFYLTTYPSLKNICLAIFARNGLQANEMTEVHLELPAKLQPHVGIDYQDSFIIIIMVDYVIFIMFTC